MNEGFEMQPDHHEARSVRPSLLRQARESRGLHVAALAAALKVPVRKLEALEEGHYEELPDLMFARALASSACRHLKVDAGPILAEMPASTVPKLGDSPQTINAPFKAPEDAPAFTLGALLSRPIAIAVIALLVVTAGLVLTPGLENVNWSDWVRQQFPSGSESVAVTPVGDSPAATVSEPVVPSLQAAPQLSAQVDGVNGDGSSGSASATNGAVEAGAAAVQAPALTQQGVAEISGAVDAGASAPSVADGAAAAAPGGLLQIRATGETWVEVANGAGEVVVNRVLTNGETLSFSSSPPYAVVIGNSAAAEVLVRGAAFDTSPYARNRVARFQVK